MDKGLLNAREPESLHMLRKIIESMLEPVQDGQRLCFTVPAAPLGAEENLTYHETTLRQILSDKGYEVKSINEGLAVVYSELESSNYTGIGISFGGGLCNVCVAYLSVPVLSFSIPRAGDYIDSNAAAMTGERANRVRIAKEDSFHFNGLFTDKLQQALSVYYDEMIQSLMQAMKQAFANSRKLPKSHAAASDCAQRRHGAAQGFSRPVREDSRGIRVADLRPPRSAWPPILCMPRPRAH